MTNPDDDRRLAKRLRAICRSVGDQVRAGELTEDRLAYALRSVVGVADALDLRARYGEASAPAGTDEPAGDPGNVVDLAERRALETAVPGRDPAGLHFSNLRAPRDPRTLTRPPGYHDPDGSGGAA